MKNIAIIGAGISGLTCAYELQKAGHTVTVFEKNNYVGGRMSTRFENRFFFDIGADHLGGRSYKELQAYCHELGVGWEPMENPKFGIYKQGKIHAAYKAVNFISQMKFAMLAKSLKNNLDFFDASSAAEFDTENAYDYLAKTVSKEAADYMANAITGGYQFHNADEMSKGALIAYMQSIKYTDWTLHHTVGGMAALPNAFAEKLDVKTGVEITSINQDTKTISYNNQEETFDLIVLATTANIADKILENKTPAQQELFNKTEYSYTISLSYFIDAEKLPKHTIVFTPWIESKTISSYSSQKQKGSELIHDGKSMLSAWLHEDFAKKIFSKSKQEILELCKDEIKKVSPWLESTDELTPNDIEKWPHSMPKYKTGYLKLVKRFMEEEQGKNNLFFTGDYLNSPWTEGAIRCGQRVAKDIISRAS